GIQAPQSTGPIAVPGRYSVRLTAAGQTQTQPLEIVRGTELTTPAADLAASTATQVRIRNDMNAAVAMINKLEVMRHQLEEQRAANAGRPDVLAAVDRMDRRMLDVEHQLVSHSDLNSDDKYYVEKYRIYLNLIWLSGEVGGGAGDVAGGAVFRPTDASLAVLHDIERDLARAKSDFDTLMRDDVPAYNRTMSGKVAAIANDLTP
ncbi:MAG TPA: hypothetical protein VFL67_00930, partial [Mycobacterium sp.]|nr:hypothetical protein [Mycobacterium sp.]